MKTAIFTGPRVISEADYVHVQTITREVISRGFQVYVGDANGVDSAVAAEAIVQHMRWYKRFPQIFQPLVSLGRTPAGLAERSARMVKEAIQASYERFHTQDETICIGFPNKPCPRAIVPAKSWKSGKPKGSGTWSTLALAVGHGIETIVFPLGSKKFHLPWGMWDNYYASVFASYRFKRVHTENLFNSFPPLAHDALCDGYTELARANSADGN